MKKITLLLFGCTTLFGSIEEIEDLCNKFTRDFTLLNIGANDGEFAFDLSNRFKNAKIIMVEDNNPHSRSLATALLNKCVESKKENLPMLISKRLGKADFKILSSCCYFDVVTILGESAYTGKQFYLLDLDEYAKSLLSLGFHTFIEVKTDSDLYRALQEHHPLECYEGDEVTLFHFVNEKKVLTRAHFLASEKERHIVVDFDRNIEIFTGQAPFKTLILQRPAALSLLDFKVLYGAFPTPDELRKFQTNLILSSNLSIYPHEIYVTTTGFELAAPYMERKDDKPCEESFIKKIIYATSKLKIQTLLKDYLSSEK